MLGYEKPSRATKNAFAGHLCPAGHRLDQTDLSNDILGYFTVWIGF